jgi:monooxygenase
MDLKPWSDFSSGYFARARDVTPKQGTIGPWRAPPNYLRDYLTLMFGPLKDGVLQFEVASDRRTTPVVEMQAAAH